MATMFKKRETKSLISEATEMAESDSVQAIADRERVQQRVQGRQRAVFGWCVVVIIVLWVVGTIAYKKLM